MIFVATENAPPGLRGRLALWLVEVRAGLYVGNYGRRVREMIWDHLVAGIADGSAVLAWATNQREAGYDVLICGSNRREPVDLDGMLLFAYVSDDSKADALLDELQRPDHQDPARFE